MFGDVGVGDGRRKREGWFFLGGVGVGFDLGLLGFE